MGVCLLPRKEIHRIKGRPFSSTVAGGSAKDVLPFLLTRGKEKNMSSSLSGNAITLTRGDSLLLKVNITQDGEPYTPGSGDKVRFAVKHRTLKEDKSDYTDETPLILKDIPTDTMLLQLDPEDTKDLAFGKYVYDIEITFPDGYVDTFITRESFKLTEEVH